MMGPRFTVNGHRLVIDLSATNTAEVEVVLPDGKRILYTLGAPPVPAPSLPYLAGLIQTFLEYKAINENRSKATLDDYRRRLNAFLDWLREKRRDPVGALDWRDYYAGVKARDLAPLSVRNHFRCLSVFAAWLVANGHLPADPLKGISPPGGSKNELPRAVDREVIRAMLQATSNVRDRALLLFFWDTGCRAGEAAGLRWRDVRPAEGTAYVVGKGDKARLLHFMPEITGKLLLAYRETVPHEKKDPLWRGKQGRLTYSGICQIFRRVAKKAGADDSNYNPHAFRHAFGRDATMNGMPTGLLQQLLGHQDIETTKIYLGFNQQETQEAHTRHSPVQEVDLGDFP